MSKVFVLLVDEENQKIFAGRLHYRQLKYLGKGELRKRLMRFELDEGYLVIDKERKVMVNGQSACPVKAKGFEIFNFF
ncbi:hypothetical protein DRJ25_01220 [Candidatus Woesearchaeota archaeon]|nr:MAG: hypothetical protein DRJ25_01220 [Candidatus Woesearchaeota archaeon]